MPYFLIILSDQVNFAHFSRPFHYLVYLAWMPTPSLCGG